MRASVNHLLKVMTTGLIVLILLSLPLFWFRFLFDYTLISGMPSTAKNIHLEPSGLVPDEIENDPNVERHSFIDASNYENNILLTLGIMDYFIGIDPGGHYSNIYWRRVDSTFDKLAWIHHEKKSGQIVFCNKTNERTHEKNSFPGYIRLYAGPEGVSDIPDKKLGRFSSPVVGKMIYNIGFILYDHQLRRFFRINFGEKTVTKGPQLPKDAYRKPVEVGISFKNAIPAALYWKGPEVKFQQPEKDTEEGSSSNNQYNPPEGRRTAGRSVTGLSARIKYKTIAHNEAYGSQAQYLPVLDETGKIDLLDRETLELIGTFGYLPAPDTLFSGKQRVRPKDLFAYDVLPLTLNTDHQYRGMFVASVNREGTALALAVFDEKGKQITTEQTMLARYDRNNSLRGYTRTSQAVYFDNPWSSTLTIGKYLLENLHPPILSILSYFTADSFEAATGHRALFILPNSFIAMKGRDIRANFAERLITALLLILPSIILAIFLARRINKDATIVGLSNNARLFWIIGTIAFGLAAYITYRLTRPTMTLVTCQNCGKPRRPDMDRCHRCKSKWHVPELIPPAWRVIV